jgi:hypothetical protein
MVGDHDRYGQGACRMIEVSLDASGPAATIAGMLRRIDHFKRVDIGQGLSEWQTDDMHRNRPFTMRNRKAGRATTLIRPHSRYEVNRSRAAQRRLTRRAKRPSYTGPTQIRHWSTRPILRSELYESLITRMTDLFGRLLVWKSSS